MTRKLSEKNYIVIADWMLDLDLNTRELLTYALIYGFSQDGKGYFGSLSYLASWLGIEDRTHVTRYLNSLVSKNLLIKSSGRSKLNQKICLYRTSADNGPVIDNPDIDYMIIQPWMMQDMHLNGKDLLLYALVHGYSRKESGNICEYKKDYFAKWLQCRKDNVDRQIRQAIKNGLIKEEKSGYVAVIPEGIEFPQTGNTPEMDEFDFTQIDNTYPQTGNTSPQSGNTSSLKMATNNLNLDNLEDNLSLNNNTEYKTKDDLSVVVNRKIFPDMDFSVSYSKDAWDYRTERDFSLYSRYRNDRIDIARFMSGYARTAQIDLELYFLDQSGEGKSLYEKGSELLLRIITNKRFAGKEDTISALSEEEISNVYRVSSRLFSKNNNERILHTKTREAYLIGTLENVLNQH